MLASNLGRSYLTCGRERELQGPLRARGKGVDLIPRIPPELLEVLLQPVNVRPSASQDLRCDVLAGHDAGQKVIRPDGRRPGRPGRSLTGAHDGLPRLLGEHLEEIARALILLLYKVQHLKRVHPAGLSPDHAQLPCTLRA